MSLSARDLYLDLAPHHEALLLDAQNKQLVGQFLTSIPNFLLD